MTLFSVITINHSQYSGAELYEFASNYKIVVCCYNRFGKGSLTS